MLGVGDGVVGGTPRVLTEERVDEINERIRQGGFAAFLGSLVGNDSRRTSEVAYPAIDGMFASLLETMMTLLARSGEVRYVHGSRANDDPKSYGGLDPLLFPRRVPVKRMSPRFISTNADVWGIDLGYTPGAQQVLFFPDTLLMFRHKRYEGVPYESLSVGHGTVLCAETSPHKAARIVGQAWAHTNLDGGPDRRYSENERVYIALYGLIRIESATGRLRLPLLVPNEGWAASLAGIFGEAFRYAGTRGGSTGGRGEEGGRRDRGGRRPPRSPERPAAGSAREVLGVGPDASGGEIVAAYRKMARMYHPDRVEGLGPEFKESAERRMKEINAAHAQLMGYSANW